MAKVITDPVVQMRELIDKFQIAQLNGAKVGATYKPVDDIFHNCLKTALRNKEVILPEDADQWGFHYTSKSDTDIADPVKTAKILTANAKECVNWIKKHVQDKPVLFSLGKVIRDFYEE